MKGYILNKLRNLKSSLLGKRVYFQIPEGLKFIISDVKEIFPDAAFSGENVYSACDMEFPENYDVVVHIGHPPIPNIDYGGRVIFVEPTIDVLEEVLSLATIVPEKRIGIGTTVEFISNIKKLKKILEENGKKFLLERGIHALPIEVKCLDVTTLLCEP